MSKRVIVFGTASEQALVRTIEELRLENAALHDDRNELRKALFKVQDEKDELTKVLTKDLQDTRSENAALREDKKLVDWIIEGDGIEWIYWQREDGVERNVTRENMHTATKGWE